MKIKYLGALMCLSFATLFGTSPTKEQVDATIQETKKYLVNTLKDPKSYKEGDWTIWISSDRDGNPHIKALHEFSSLNGFGGRNQDTILVSSPTPRKKSRFCKILDGYVVANMDIGAMMLENMKKELSNISEENIVHIKVKRMLGDEEIK